MSDAARGAVIAALLVAAPAVVLVVVAAVMGWNQPPMGVLLAMLAGMGLCCAIQWTAALEAWAFSMGKGVVLGRFIVFFGCFLCVLGLIFGLCAR